MATSSDGVVLRHGQQPGWLTRHWKMGGGPWLPPVGYPCCHVRWDYFYRCGVLLPAQRRLHLRRDSSANESARGQEDRHAAQSRLARNREHQHLRPIRKRQSGHTDSWSAGTWDNLPSGKEECRHMAVRNVAGGGGRRTATNRSFATGTKSSHRTIEWSGAAAYRLRTNTGKSVN